MSPGELANAAGVSENAVRQMELGYTKSASFAVGVKMADALGVTARHLAIGDEPEAVTLPTADRALAEITARLEVAVRENREALARMAERQDASIGIVSRRLDQIEKRVSEKRPPRQKAG